MRRAVLVHIALPFIPLTHLRKSTLRLLPSPQNLPQSTNQYPQKPAGSPSAVLWYWHPRAPGQQNAPFGCRAPGPYPGLPT